MSSSKTFVTLDLRAVRTLSPKQLANAKMFNLIKEWKDLTEKELKLVKSQEEWSSFYGEQFCNIFKFSVKTSFLDKCPDPENYGIEQLFNDFKMNDYIHNEVGPAFINLVGNREEFYIEGKQVDPELAKKMTHNSNFIKKLDGILTE